MRLLLLSLVACGGPHPVTDAGDVPASGTLWISSYNSTRPQQYGGRASVQLPQGAANCQSVEVVAGCTFSKNCVVSFMPPLAPVTVGTIQIAGTTPPITLTPTTAGDEPIDTSAPLFIGGEQIQVSFDDGTTTSITAPSQPRITSFPSDPVVMDRSQDVPVTWEGATTGDIELVFAEGIDETDALACRVPAASGSAMLPAAALAKLGYSPILYVYARARAEVQLPAVQLTVAPTFEGVLPDGSYADVHVEFTP